MKTYPHTEHTSSQWKRTDRSGGSSPHISWIDVTRQWRCACYRATAGTRTRGVLEQYVAGFEVRGRPGGKIISAVEV